MSSIPEDIKYTEDHEWIRMEDEFQGVCGITDYAQEMLTDIVFVELPDEEIEVNQGDQVGVVESVKAVSDIHSPVTGRIVKVNKSLEDSPELINSDPYEEGWIFVIEIKKKNEMESLMDFKDYEKKIDGEE